MEPETVEYRPIGVVHTPFDSPEGVPIQPIGASDIRATITLFEGFETGLSDLDTFSHCIVLYHFHESDGEASMTVEPFVDETERGLFATRAPRRPNAIGLSIVEIEDIEGTTVTVRGADVVDGTPVLDLKPFVPAFDVPESATAGWLEGHTETARHARADDRFRE